MNKPKPVAYLRTEDDDWQPWGFGRRDRIYAIQFDDGSIFDIYLGWIASPKATRLEARVNNRVEKGPVSIAQILAETHDLGLFTSRVYKEDDDWFIELTFDDQSTTTYGLEDL